MLKAQGRRDDVRQVGGADKAPADQGKPRKPVDAKSLQLNEQGVAAVKAKDFGKAEQLFLQIGLNGF